VAVASAETYASLQLVPDRQPTMPPPHRSVFYSPDALPASQPTSSKHRRLRTLVEVIAVATFGKDTVLPLVLLGRNDHHHHGRVAGEGRRVVVPPCPRHSELSSRTGGIVS